MLMSTGWHVRLFVLLYGIGNIILLILLLGAHKSLNVFSSQAVGQSVETHGTEMPKSKGVEKHAEAFPPNYRKRNAFVSFYYERKRDRKKWQNNAALSGFLCAMKAFSSFETEHIMFVDPDVSQETVRNIERYGYQVQELRAFPRFDPRVTSLEASHHTKLMSWALTEFDKIILLDIDSWPVRNIDWLFDVEPLHGQAAVHINRAGREDANSGVVILRPSAGVFSRLIATTIRGNWSIMPQSGTGDQVILNQASLMEFDRLSPGLNFKYPAPPSRMPKGRERKTQSFLRPEDVFIIHDYISQQSEFDAWAKKNYCKNFTMLVDAISKATPEICPVKPSSTG
eukprot:gb/GECG01009376.1/.p1 GENE.gb/GECG01009376.1/~~gb/GECG01009376.1/.p1  ORF type:complete len:341 (+),score=25.76 gb/GECG01009376.1/:1-1023(+)